MIKCDECGRPARTVYPYVRRDAAAVKFMHQDRALSRLALYVLDPAMEASIPWGQHPDDDQFGTACEACAREMAA